MRSISLPNFPLKMKPHTLSDDQYPQNHKHVGICKSMKNQPKPLSLFSIGTNEKQLKISFSFCTTIKDLPCQSEMRSDT